MGWPHLPLTPVGSPRRLNRTCGGPARTSGGRHLGRRCRRAVSGERTASVGAARRRLGPRTLRAAAGTSHDHRHGEADLDVAAGRGGRRPSGPDRLQGCVPAFGEPESSPDPSSTRNRSTGVPGRSGQGSARLSLPVSHSRTAMPASSCSWSARVVEDVPHQAADHLGRRLRLLRRRPGATTRAGPRRPHHPCRRRGDGTGSARPGRRDPVSGAGLSGVRGCRPATAPGGRAGRPAPGPARRAPSGGPPVRAGRPPSARPA
jgi:hypothetical protein